MGFEIEEIVLDDQGYDEFGSYYGIGIGERLWRVYPVDGTDAKIVRASDLSDTIASFIREG